MEDGWAQGDPWEGPVGLSIIQDGIWGEADPLNNVNVSAANPTATFTFHPNSSFDVTNYTIQVEEKKFFNEKFLNCQLKLTTQKFGCSADQCNTDPTNIESGGTPQSVALETFSLCKQIPEEQTAQRSACEQCTGGSGEYEGNKGVWTAIGCISRDPESILQKFISVGLGMSGGVALLTFLAAGFIFSTSQGDPKAYGKAKEMMTASIMGIIFVIFSVTILQFIGFSILKIPGFGG